MTETDETRPDPEPTDAATEDTSADAGDTTAETLTGSAAPEPAEDPETPDADDERGLLADAADPQPRPYDEGTVQEDGQ